MFREETGYAINKLECKRTSLGQRFGGKWMHDGIAGDGGCPDKDVRSRLITSEAIQTVAVSPLWARELRSHGLSTNGQEVNRARERVQVTPSTAGSFQRRPSGVRRQSIPCCVCTRAQPPRRATPIIHYPITQQLHGLTDRPTERPSPPYHPAFNRFIKSTQLLLFPKHHWVFTDRND